MHIAELKIENFRCFGAGDNGLTITFSPGLTALVGENDSGKTAVIDALRLILGTRDQEFFRTQDSDFHYPSGGTREDEISIRCRFDGLSDEEKGAFAEYLTYVKAGGIHDAALFICWTARDMAGARSTRRFVSVEARTGEKGDGPVLDAEARDLLRATYLRPLRDAERAMAAGRGSRLSQILQHTKEIRDAGEDFDPSIATTDTRKLSVLGVGDYANKLLQDRQEIAEARKRLNEEYLAPLSLSGDSLAAAIGVSAASDDEARLRHLLEKLELDLQADDGSSNIRGLGSNNLLFMACELLLLGSEEGGLLLLLIEEPEAHLHPQRQARLMQFLEDQAEAAPEGNRRIQIIVTTHSPNIASAIKVENIVLLEGERAFPLTAGSTELDRSDYRFLERFLDVTKANLFFARGVVIVEGDGENILLPTIARLIDRDFTEHGVSIVNVGGTGLRRFARIFQRSDPASDGILQIPVACIADLDVMPDIAASITGKLAESQAVPDKASRRWRMRSDFTQDELTAHADQIRAKADGQRVRTFVSEQWTFEYDLAFAGLAEDVWVAAHLAKADDQINQGSKDPKDVASDSSKSFAQFESEHDKEKIASHVYSMFTNRSTVSKAIAAQYLSARLEEQVRSGGLTASALKAKLPPYLVSAIEHVTRART